MSVAIRLAAAAALLLSACSLDVSRKIGCNTGADCLSGYVCVASRCTPVTGGGGTAGGGNGGNMSMTDAGPGDGPPPRMCPTTGVNACLPGGTGTLCEETFCGGRLWRNQVMHSLLVPYRIDGTFSSSYRAAIRAGAAAWTRASSGFVTFQDCGNFCTGRFISVVPGGGDGITNPDALGEQFLPLPVVGSGRISPHRIAHQWGHVVGLAHTYERADRDRYLRFDPQIWCPPEGSGLPPRCAAGPMGPEGIPAVTSGTFGVFDEKSKMNGFRSEGICGAEEPDDDSGEPTIGDTSAMAELFFGVATRWSPFRPIGRSVSPDQPLDYQLSPGVDPVGSPAIAEVEYARPEIFVRGTDDRVYATTRLDPLTSSEWAAWSPVPDDVDDVDADPAVVFAVNADPATLFLAVRSRDGNIHLRARVGGTWSGRTSLGAPPAGAASAPALASETPGSLAVLVRGGDGLIYWLACTDALLGCPSASLPNAWKALPPPPSGVFVGKPSAIWLLDNMGLTVAAIRDDRVAMVITKAHMGGLDWLPAEYVNLDLAPDDPDPGVAMTFSETPGDPAFYARNQRGLLVSQTLLLRFFPIGGVLASPPAAVGVFHAAVRTDVAAIIDDHGRPGVWWRFRDNNYMAPCNYNRPGTCAQCGL